MDVSDIREQMAFDLTEDEAWCKAQAKKAELEKSRSLSAEQRAAALKAAFSGLSNGNPK